VLAAGGREGRGGPLRRVLHQEAAGEGEGCAGGTGWWPEAPMWRSSSTPAPWPWTTRRCRRGSIQVRALGFCCIWPIACSLLWLHTDAWVWLKGAAILEKRTYSFSEDTKALLLDIVLAGTEHQMIGESDSKLNSEFAELLNSHIRKAVIIGNQTKTKTSSISSLLSWSTTAFTVASTSFSWSRWTRSLSTLGSVLFFCYIKQTQILGL